MAQCARLPSAGKRRLVVLTGARQTGKTTLARQVYADLRYLNLDAIEEREALRGLRSASWGRAVGAAVIDEAQKEPGVFDKVKLAYDERQVAFSVLLGSSRVLLLDRVRESLAGRAFVYDLWPLMASELRHADHEVSRAPAARSPHRRAGVVRGDPGCRAGAAARRRGHESRRGPGSSRGLGRHAGAAGARRRRPPRVAALLPADVARARPRGPDPRLRPAAVSRAAAAGDGCAPVSS